MGVLIDASVLIEHERGRLDLERRLEGREGEEVFLSAITASELLHGVHRAQDATTRARRSALVEATLEAFFHARFFLEMAVRYADLAAPPQPLPSGYAALLYLFGLR
jgi:tRNA(fMet)-specific endonuclease VapC